MTYPLKKNNIPIFGLSCGIPAGKRHVPVQFSSLFTSPNEPETMNPDTSGCGARRHNNSWRDWRRCAAAKKFLHLVANYPRLVYKWLIFLVFPMFFLALLIPFPGLPPGAYKFPGEHHYVLKLGDCWMLVLYICVCTYIYIILYIQYYIYICIHTHTVLLCMYIYI